jgi:hypothetical protein
VSSDEGITIEIAFMVYMQILAGPGLSLLALKDVMFVGSGVL